MSDIRVSTSGHSSDRSRGSQPELRAGTGDQKSSTSGDLHTSRMGRDEASGRKMEGINACRGLLQGQQVCAVHDISHHTGVTVGAELPKLCSGPSGGTERVPGNEEQDGSGDGKKIRSRIQAAPWKLSHPSNVDWEVISQAAQPTSPRTTVAMGPLKRAMEEDEKHKMIPEFRMETRKDKMTKMAVMQREIERPKGAADSVREEIQIQNEMAKGCASTSHLCQQIESAQLTIEKDLAKLHSLWKTSAKQCEGSQRWHLDVLSLEVYCEPDCQITEQCQRLGLPAERFTVHDGDLATSAGRDALWKRIVEKKPKEIWMSPESKNIGATTVVETWAEASAQPTGFLMVGKSNGSI